MPTEDHFREALAAAPGDRTLMLVFADWLDEQERAAEAAEYRQRAADESLAEPLRLLLGRRANVITRVGVELLSGHRARRARTCFDRYARCRVAVIGGVAPAELGLLPGDETVVYYQTGKWVNRYRYQPVGPKGASGTEPGTINPAPCSGES